MVLGAPALAEGCVDQGGRVMKLVPFHRFSFTTRLSRAAALAALGAHVEPEKWFRTTRPRDDRRFEGFIEGDALHMRRIIGYRNSFLPVVTGRIEDAPGGARVRIAMRPFIFVMVFMAIWLFAFGAILLSGGSDMTIFAALIVLVAYAMITGGFWFEAAKQERTLREILQAAPDAPPIVSPPR